MGNQVRLLDIAGLFLTTEAVVANKPEPPAAAPAAGADMVYAQQEQVRRIEANTELASINAQLESQHQEYLQMTSAGLKITRAKAPSDAVATTSSLPASA